MEMRKQMKLDLTLYGITDRRWTKNLTLAKQVEQAIVGGATIIQYREKNLTGAEKKTEAIEIQKICKKYNVPFLINDDVELAKEIDADGVHLGQGDMEISKAREILDEKILGCDTCSGDAKASKCTRKIIGITAKTVEQAKLAEAGGADYLGSGAVFGTSTKTDAKPMEHELLDQICASVSIPVVAIGGIEKDNIMKLKGRKMSGFAVVSAIFKNEDITEATIELRKLAEETLGR